MALLWGLGLGWERVVVQRVLLVVSLTSKSGLRGESQDLLSVRKARKIGLVSLCLEGGVGVVDRGGMGESIGKRQCHCSAYSILSPNLCSMTCLKSFYIAGFLA